MHLGGGVAHDGLLVPSGNEVIDSLTIDAQNVYFTVGNEIRRVARAGGPVTLVKALGAPPRDLFVTDTSLYFRLEVRKRTGEITGPGRGDRPHREVTRACYTRVRDETILAFASRVGRSPRYRVRV